MGRAYHGVYGRFRYQERRPAGIYGMAESGLGAP
jgi:hypothetical protein